MEHNEPINLYVLVRQAVKDLDRYGVTCLGTIETPNGADRIYMHRDGLPRVSICGRGDLIQICER